MNLKLIRCVVCFMLALLVSCNMGTTPLPTYTPPSNDTSTPTSTPSLTPSPTLTFTPSPIPPTATPTPRPTQRYIPQNAMVGVPTPIPGWSTYINDYLGYTINIPSDAVISERGAEGMDSNVSIPPGFTFEEYLDYTHDIFPKKLCVSFEIPGASVTITPPYEPLGSFMGPCPGLGIGSQYNWQGSPETLWIAGREYKDTQGTKLYLKSTGDFDFEFYAYNLDNGFAVRWNGGPQGKMSYDSYLPQRAIVLETIATLHWYRAPNLEIPGTTCAGKFTRLARTVDAMIVGDAVAEVRTGPQAADSLIGQLPPGSIVKILDGPICRDGLVVWQVVSDLIDGGVGWTAEGDGTNYWLEPYKP
jgi:hypothetical protein